MKSRTFLRDANSVLSGKFAATVVSFATNLLVTRVLGPELKGLLLGITVYPRLIVSLGELGVRQASAQKIGQNPDSKSIVISSVLWIIAISSIISIAVCGLIFSFKVNGSIVVMLLAMSGIPIGIACSHGSGILLGCSKIREYSRYSWMGGIIQISGCIVLLVLFKLEVLGAVIASLIGGLFSVSYIFWLIAKISPIRWCWDYTTIKSLFTKGIIFSIALFINSLNYRIGIVMLDRMSNQGEIGQFGLSVQLAEFIWQIPSALSVVVFSRSVTSNDPIQQTTNTAMLMRVMLLFSILGAALLYLCSDWLIPFVFGVSFAGSIGIFKSILPGVVSMCAFRILNSDLAGKGWPMHGTLASIPGLLTSIILCFLWIPSDGGLGAAKAVNIGFLISGLSIFAIYSLKAKIGLNRLLLPRKSDFFFLRRIIKSRM